MNQSELVSAVSDKSEPFNEEMIFYRERESIIAHLENICRALEVIEYIKFVGLDWEDDESKMTAFSTVDIKQARFAEVTMRFRVTYKGETQDVIKKTFIPRLVDNFFFIINGIRYYPIYQIVDRGVFVTPKVYSLKTLLMPIRFKYKRVAMADAHDQEFEAHEFELNLFKNSISYLYYFFAKMGLHGTLGYFGYEYGDGADLLLVEADELEDLSAYKKSIFYSFWLKGDLWLIAKKKTFKTEEQKSFLYSLVEVLSVIGDVEDIEEEWLRVLGSLFTKSANSRVDKARKVLFSLERILDDETKRILSEIKPEDKEDTYSIIRWMLREFETHQYQDNVSLRCKRMQCWEYLTNPLLRFFSNATYRILNTRNLTIRTLTGVFNIGPNFLTKRLLSNELVRYEGGVNAIDLFGASLKVTMRGAGSIGGSGGDVSDRYRGVHKSYVGNLSLVTASPGDPGLSAVLTPFANVEEGVFNMLEDELADKPTKKAKKPATKKRGREKK